ncbi:MAG: hypothetical protein OHK0053_36150 [Microscillaceae bacterium]
MHQWASYIFLRFVLFLALGILAQKLGNGHWGWGLGLFLASGSGYVLAWGLMSSRQKRLFHPVLGFLAALVLVGAGAFRTYQFEAHHWPGHFQTTEGIEAYRLRLVSEVQIRPKNYRAEGEVSHIRQKGRWQKATGLVRVYLPKTDSGPPPEYGNVLLIRGCPQIVPPLKNPAGFDYKSYLYFQNIYHQHFVRAGQFAILPIERPGAGYLYGLALQLRAQGREILQKYIRDPAAQATALALLLGVKDQLDEDLRQSFAGSGLMHILAVSGLHVGIMMLILNYLLQGLKTWRGGQYWFFISASGLLFLYAFVTGLSPSVLRAVLMFSLVLAAKTFRRRGLIYNNIALSAFILLLYNPFLLWSISFQLSYLAVLGIVYLQGKIYRLWALRNYWLDKAWELTSVSLAAQVATTPLSLYYFHQFPNYFILANLLVLPLLGVVLCGGMAFLFLSGLPYVGEGLGWIVGNMMAFINAVAQGVQQLPGAVSQGWWLTEVELLGLYASIATFLLLLAYRQLIYLVLSCIALLGVSGSMSTRAYWQNQQKALYILHTPGQAHLVVLNGRTAYLLAEEKIWENSGFLAFTWRPFLTSRGIREVKYGLFSQNKPALAYRARGNFGLLVWEGKTLLIVRAYARQDEWLPWQNTRWDCVVAQQRSLYQLEAFPEGFRFQTLVFDPSFSPYRAAALARAARKKGQKVHTVAEEGFWQWKIR